MAQHPFFIIISLVKLFDFDKKKVLHFDYVS